MDNTEINKIKDVHELLYSFGDFSLANYTISDIDSLDDNKTVKVYAAVKDRGSPFYSDGVYKVKNIHNGTPITEKIDPPQTISESDLVDLMPYKMKSRMTVVSVRGQYLEVIEHNPNGRNNGRVNWIPVEFVIKP